MSQGTDVVDWDLAVATGRRLVRPGPAVTADEARAVVAELREAAVQAQGHVARVTGLHADEGGPGSVLVVDRPGWLEANAAGFREVLEPVLRAVVEKRQAQGSPGSGLGGVGARVTGVETGALLAFLAGKVLGQYELFSPDPSRSAGRLLLVAPNVVAAEQQMRVDTSDFRLWVCVHEETHRVQFGAVPWLREHLLEQVNLFFGESDLDPRAVLQRLWAAVDAVADSVRDEPKGRSLIDVVQTERQRELLAGMTALMSLLEGHADHVMDAVGPEVIPTVAEIRTRFQQRRKGSGRLDVALRRLLGLEAKMQQYRDGARFVGAVVDSVGMTGFNKVWESPDTLPLPAEIVRPQDWVARVHGLAA